MRWWPPVQNAPGPRASAPAMLVCPLQLQRTPVLSVTASVSPRNDRPECAGDPRSQREVGPVSSPNWVGMHRVSTGMRPPDLSAGGGQPRTTSQSRRASVHTGFRHCSQRKGPGLPEETVQGVQEGPSAGRMCPHQRQRPRRGCVGGPGPARAPSGRSWGKASVGTKGAGRECWATARV